MGIPRYLGGQIAVYPGRRSSRARPAGSVRARAGPRRRPEPVARSYHPDMPAPSDPLPLAAEFPPATRDQWIELVTGVLRRVGPAGGRRSGRRAEQHDVRRDLGAAALHRRRRAARAGRDARLRAVRAGRDRRRADADRLGRPAAARRPRSGRGCGPACWTTWRPARPRSGWCWARPACRLPTCPPRWRAVVRSDPVDCPVALDAGAQTAEAAAAFLRLVGERGLDPAEVRGSLGADPIGLRARTGATADLEPAGRRRPGPPEPAGGDRRRDRLPRRRRERRDRAGGRHRGRGGVPAGADRRRARRRRGAGRGGVPVRGDARTSSPRSPSCARPGGSGPGSPSSARREPDRAASGSTRSPRPR